MSNNDRIIFKRSGGFMGRSKEITLDLNSFPLEEKKMIDKLVFNRSSNENQKQESVGADYFTYEITIIRNNVSNTIKSNELNTDKDIAPLIDLLNKKVEENE